MLKYHATLAAAEDTCATCFLAAMYNMNIKDKHPFLHHERQAKKGTKLSRFHPNKLY
jgi:hypothetical protein